MTGDERGSVTGWLGNLREGDQAAAQPLWERYFSRLVVVARGKLKRMRRSTADQDEEDAALSAFNSFCAGAAQGQFPQLADREDLWRLLVVITARKAMAQANREGRQKRGGGRVVEEAVLVGKGLEGGEGSIAGLERIAAAGPTPEFAAMMAEECRRLLDALGDDSSARSPSAGWKGTTMTRSPTSSAAPPNRRAAAGTDPQDLDGRGARRLMEQPADTPQRAATLPGCDGSMPRAKNLKPSWRAGGRPRSRRRSRPRNRHDRDMLVEEL